MPASAHGSRLAASAGHQLAKPRQSGPSPTLLFFWELRRVLQLGGLLRKCRLCWIPDRGLSQAIEAMQHTLTNLLGTLPPKFFDVRVSAVRWVPIANS